MKTLFFARDPGAANVIATLSGCLEAAEVILAAKDAARKHFERFDLKTLDLNALIADRPLGISDAPLVEEWLSSLGPISAIVTGTSDVDDYCDRLLWGAAHRLDIPSIAVLDLELAVHERFEGTSQPLGPDIILVPTHELTEDARLKTHARQDVITIGRPYLHQLYEKRNNWLSQRHVVREKLQTTFGFREGPIVLYASEMQRTANGSGGFRELDTLSLVRDVCLSAWPESNLIVKAHPRENADELRTLLPEVIHTEHESLALIAASDLVIGIKSIMLLEASLLERPAISYTEWDTEASSFIGNIRGLTAVAANAVSLESYVRTRPQPPSHEALCKELFVVPQWKVLFRHTLAEAMSR